MYRWDNKSDTTAEKCFFAEKLKSEYPILKHDEQAGKLLCHLLSNQRIITTAHQRSLSQLALPSFHRHNLYSEDLF
jgi:hypothetical protein